MDKILFFKVFNNLYLKYQIFKFIKLYKKNEYIYFKEIKELIEYKEREYIKEVGINTSFKYGEYSVLLLGDLPTCGVLEKVELLNSTLSRSRGQSIPFGVKILNFSLNSNFKETIPFKELPESIHTINNVYILYNSKDNRYEITPNITSISFLQLPNISNNNEFNNGFIKIPNTIKTLKFNVNWNNEGVKLRIGDLPNGLINLSMLGYKSSNLINQDNGGECILPTTLKSLEISYKLLLSSKIELLKNIEKLLIETSKDIEINTIPNNIKDLTILMKDNSYNTNCKIGSIPNSVTNLTINRFIEDDGIFPLSLSNFKFLITNNDNNNNENLNKMLSLLSKLPNLTSIQLPNEYESFQNIQSLFPFKINYNNKLTCM